MVLRVAVDSSSLASVGYSSRGQTLEVEFHSGLIYQYLGVPAAVYEELLKTESKGAFFNRMIRDVYPFRRT